MRIRKNGETGGYARWVLALLARDFFQGVRVRLLQTSASPPTIESRTEAGSGVGRAMIEMVVFAVVNTPAEL
jgi:hypothetical protein